MNTTSTEDILKNDTKSEEEAIEIEGKESQKSRIPEILLRNKNDIISCSIFGLITIYFTWATQYYLEKTGYSLEAFNSTTCSGYGFLVIIYCFYFYFLLHKYLIGPFVVKCFSRIIWLPTKNLLIRIPYGNVIFYVTVLIAIIVHLIFDTSGNRERLIPLSGLVFFLLVGFITSYNRKAIKWRTIIWGLFLQYFFGLLTIRWEIGRNILQCLGDKVNLLLNYAFEGAAFTYGNLLIKQEAVFAFKALSTIYFMSLIVNILYYYGIMQKIVGSVGSFLSWIMDTTICESLNSAANIILSLTEAPLLLTPYLKNLTDSEIHSVMASGFATVSGSVLAAYITFGARPQDLITASIMSAPAALCFSKLIYPETEKVLVHKDNIHVVDLEYDSVLDAASKGASTGIQIVLGVIASVIAFLAFVYWIDGILGWMGEMVGYTDPFWSLDLILGKILTPISYLMGVPWSECEKVATLIGIKTMVNEFVAFEKMSTMELQTRTKVIATYAICGFSNPGSIGIMISAMSALIPNKREVITRLVLRAFFSGALVCFMTACIAGVLMPDDAL